MKRAIVAVVTTLMTTGLTLAALGLANAQTAPAVSINENATLHSVPSQYLGLSVESANLCYVVSMTQTDPAFVQLFENLGPGTFRIGGNTGDKNATWSTTAAASCKWNQLVVTPALVSQFFAFAQSIGWRVIWQVPLLNGQPAEDAAEAAYVATMPDLYGIAIGNEPNFYPDATADVSTYIADWDTVYADYQADGGTAPVVGPDATVSASWYDAPFLSQNAANIEAVTGHWYIGSASTSHPTCTSMLKTTGSAIAAEGVAEASAYGLPFLMDETNSYSDGGTNGVSNAYCSALWGAAYGLNALTAGVQGIYFHGTADYKPGNSAGILNYYSPITATGTPTPLYYGLLLASQLTQTGGNQVQATASGGVSAYAVMGASGSLQIALINLTAAAETVPITTANDYASAAEITLAGPSLTSLTGVTLGGTAVASDGSWTSAPVAVPVSGNTMTVALPADSAAIITCTP
jgi:hypothetical protein